MDYRPPSKRDVFDSDLDTLHETVMPWMVPPLKRWFQPLLINEAHYDYDFIEGLEMATRLRAPLDRRNIWGEFEHRLENDPWFGLDAAAYALSRTTIIRTATHTLRFRPAETLDRLLRESGSAWEVTELDIESGKEGEKALILTRRDLAAAKCAILDIRSQHDRPGRFLTDAWKAIASRDPHTNEAYDKAVKAIEAAAQPVVTPKDHKATLGKMISAMRLDFRDLMRR